MTENKFLFVFVNFILLIKFVVLIVLYFLLQILNVLFEFLFVFIFKLCQTENLIIGFQLTEQDVFWYFLHYDFLMLFLFLYLLLVLENLFGDLFVVNVFDIKQQKATNQKNQHGNQGFHDRNLLVQILETSRGKSLMRVKGSVVTRILFYADFAAQLLRESHYKKYNFKYN